MSAAGCRPKGPRRRSARSSGSTARPPARMRGRGRASPSRRVSSSRWCARSTPGRGSAFRFALRLGAAEGEASPHELPGDGRSTPAAIRSPTMPPRRRGAWGHDGRTDVPSEPGLRALRDAVRQGAPRRGAHATRRRRSGPWLAGPCAARDASPIRWRRAACGAGLPPQSPEAVGCGFAGRMGEARAVRPRPDRPGDARAPLPSRPPPRGRAGRRGARSPA